MVKRGFKTAVPKTAADPPVAKVQGKPFTFTPAWKLLKPNLQLVRQNIEVTAVVLLLPILVLVLGSVLSQDNMVVSTRLLIGGAVTLIACIWLFLNIPVVYYFQLRAIGPNKPGIVECYRQGIRYLPRLVGLMALTGLLISLGFLLFIVPGLILFRRYILAPYFLVDEDLGIREAMQRSAAATKSARRYVWDVIGLMLAVSLLVAGLTQLLPTPYGEIVGLLAVGLYVFVPVLRYKEIALHKSALSTRS